MDRKFIILKRYPGLRGVDDDVIRQVADDCIEVSLAKGDFLHRAGEVLDHFYFIGEGRLEQTIFDLHGNIAGRRFLTRGAHFGAIAGADQKPVPTDCVALEPSVVLRMDYEKLLDYLSQHRQLLVNFIQDVGSAFKQSFRVDRQNVRPNIVLVLHNSPATRAVTHRLIDRLQELGERPCVLTDDPAWQTRDDVPQVLMVQDGQWMEIVQVREKVAGWAAHERVFIDLSTSNDLARLVRMCQLAEFILAALSTTDYQETLDRLTELQTEEPEWREKTAIAWLLRGTEMHSPLVAKQENVASFDFKLSFDGPPENKGPILRNGLERIVHYLRGVRLGIALGGGAARGMAHLGVLKTLEQHGIIVDMIAGTSAGAMTGTVYAAGLDVDYAASRFVADLTPSWLFRKMRHGGYWYLLYQYRRGQFDPKLRKYLSDLDLRQLPVPMSSITVDLVSGEPKVRDRGDAVNGILESINLPGLSAPICHDGQALVDGGLINNVPADVLVSKGCNFVIAVSVTAKLEQEFANIRPDSTGSSHKTPSVTQTILRGYLVQSVNMNSIGIQPADMMIDVDVTQFDLSEFSRTVELAAAGAETTESMLASIKSELSKLDPQLFAGKSEQPVPAQS